MMGTVAPLSILWSKKTNNMKKTIMTAVLVAALGMTKAQQPGQVKILFDCTKAETAGNADWIIDADLHNLTWNPNANTGSSYTKSNPQQYPTPTQTTVTSSTAETYWEGALSNWGIDCVNKGFWVETLPPITGQITYGNNSNPQDLSNYHVYIVDEPNIVFTSAEKTAMMNFVQNGGALFMISDHETSDRNNDGWDSPNIWNDFITNNPVQNNAFGIHFALENFSQTSTNVTTVSTDSIIFGTYGSVSEVMWSNGTSMNIKTSENPSVKACIWKLGMGQTDTAILCSYARYGCGRVAAIGDSSPPDDGTGNPNSSLYNGYTHDANGNHRPWLMNITIWLAEAGCQTTTGISQKYDASPGEFYPNPASDLAQINIPPDLHSLSSFHLYDISGKEMQINCTGSGLGENQNSLRVNTTALSNGVYFCSFLSEGKYYSRKLVIAK